MISANRSARKSARAGPVFRTGRAGFSHCPRVAKLGALYADMVNSAISNIEDTFANIDVDTLKQAAETIWAARRVFTLGVGVNSSNASNFTYLASTGMVEFYAIPKPGSVATDDLAWADSRDVLIAMTSKPYRREVVEAVRIAREQGVKVIGVSDSAASPIIIGSEFGFVVSVDTPQFFPILGVDHRLSGNAAVLCHRIGDS
jgi:DNA-binding MurR/RpiR family transcriptional regulator